MLKKEKQKKCLKKKIWKQLLRYYPLLIRTDIKKLKKKSVVYLFFNYTLACTLIRLTKQKGPELSKSQIQSDPGDCPGRGPWLCTPGSVSAFGKILVGTGLADGGHQIAGGTPTNKIHTYIINERTNKNQNVWCK